MTFREHLQTLYDQHGKLTPTIVLEAARPKNSPLHGYVFDRAPREAAEAWYLHRAGQLIRVARIVYAEAGEHGPAKSVRAFHYTPREDGHSYEPAERVALDPIMREVVLAQMRRDWKALQARYGQFAEFVELVRRALDDEEKAA